MRGPKPLSVEVTLEERAGLERLVRAHTTPQRLVRRARIVLAAADGANNEQIVNLWLKVHHRIGDCVIDVGADRAV